MRKHVNEVEHDYVEVVFLKLREIAQEFLSGCRIVDFVVRETAFAAESLKLSGDERRFVEVFAFGLVLVHPQVGEHSGDVNGHKSGEYGVSGVLCGGWEDRGVQILVDGEKVVKKGANGAPLVKTEVVNEDEESS